MSSVNSLNLTLTTVGANTTITVSYNAVFSQFDAFLASNGLIFIERIQVVGVGPSGSTTGTILHNFPALNMAPIIPGSTPRTRSITVTSASLQEDAGLGDDEIRCRVQNEPRGMPTLVTDFTNQERVTDFTNQEILVA